MSTFLKHSLFTFVFSNRRYVNIAQVIYVTIKIRYLKLFLMSFTSFQTNDL